MQQAVRTTSLALVLFCVGHFFIDMYSGALGALQPMLVTQYRLSFTQAGVLGGVLYFSSSMLQPVYGYFSDRFHTKLFTALAPAMAGIFISAVGLAPDYFALLVMVFLGGCGIASFHPQAAASATAGVVRNRGRAMAIFISSGTLGLALGPTFFSKVSQRWGLPGATWLAVPGIVLSLGLLVWQRAPVRHTRPRFDWAPLRAVWKPMTILYLLVFIRSVVQVTFSQFLPLYLNTQRGYTLSQSSYSLSLYLFAGALGGLVGGNLADRFGGRRVIMISMIGSVPFLALFVFSSGIVSTLALMMGGLILLFTIPVNVVMGQELAPSQTGTVSALMMGFAWGSAGLLFIPLTGWVSDVFSMQTAFIGLVAFPIIGFFLAMKLPK
jgi:FSR family fosmidomycin resistance protein-like MFS transporter